MSWQGLASSGWNPWRRANGRELFGLGIQECGNENRPAIADMDVTSSHLNDTPSREAQNKG